MCFIGGRQFEWRMGMRQEVIFAKKIVLPSASANILQSLNMASAFKDAGALVWCRPGFKTSIGERLTGGSSLQKRYAELLQGYGLVSPCPAVPVWHKGLYGAGFRRWLFGRMLFGKERLLYARDMSEASFIVKGLQLCPQRNHTFIYEMHELLFVQHRQSGKAGWQEVRQREGSVLGAVHGLVVINEQLGCAAKEEWGYDGPVLTEPSGYNPNLFHPVPLFTETAPWPEGDDPVQLVYVGSLRPGKGVPELLKAMALLPRRFHLRVIGSGGSGALEALREQSRDIPNAEERIAFTGHVPQSRVREACLGAHISVLPQQTGQGYFSPMKLNESLALGLPVVATPLRLFAPQAELLYRAEDVSSEALARAVDALVRNPGHAGLLRERGIREAERYTWQARAARILEWSRQLRRTPINFEQR